MKQWCCPEDSHWYIIASHFRFTRRSGSPDPPKRLALKRVSLILRLRSLPISIVVGGGWNDMPMTAPTVLSTSGSWTCCFELQMIQKLDWLNCLDVYVWVQVPVSSGCHYFADDKNVASRGVGRRTELPGRPTGVRSHVEKQLLAGGSAVGQGLRFFSEEQAARGQVIKFTEQEAKGRCPNLVFASLAPFGRMSPMVQLPLASSLKLTGSQSIDVRVFGARKGRRSLRTSSAPWKEKADIGRSTFALTGDVGEALCQAPIHPQDGHVLGCQVIVRECR